MPPTPEQIETALAGGYGAIVQEWKFERVSPANVFIVDRTDMLQNCSMTMRNERAVRGEVKATVQYHESVGMPFAAFQVYRITEQRTILGEVVDFPRGLWVITGVEILRHEADMVEASLTLGDLTAATVYSSIEDSITFTAGSTYIECMEAVLNGINVQHDLQWQGPDPEPTLPVDYVVPDKTSFYEILRKLAEGINYYIPYPDVNGVFVTRPVVDPWDEPIAVTYSDENEPRMITSKPPISISGDVVDFGSIPNVCQVMIDDPRRLSGLILEASRSGSTGPITWGTSLSFEANGTFFWTVATILTDVYVVRINALTGGINNIWAAPVSNNIHGVAVEDPPDFVWISDNDGTLYRRAAADGSADSSFTPAFAPNDIAIDTATGDMWYTCRNVGLLEFMFMENIAGGPIFLTEFPGSIGAMARDPDGVHVWTYQPNGQMIYKALPISGQDAQLVRIIPNPVGGTIVGIAVDANNKLWLSSFQGGAVTLYRFDQNGPRDFGSVTYENADPTSPISTVNKVPYAITVKAGSRPSTEVIYNTDTARDIAKTQLQLADASTTKVKFETLPDPRRWILETYHLEAEGVSDNKVRCREWKQTLSPGAPMQHETVAVFPVTITEVV